MNPKILKFFFVFVSIIGVGFFSSCKKEKIKKIIDDSNYPTWNGIWTLVSYEDFSAGEQILKDNTNNPNNGDVVINIIDSVGDGRFKGHSLINPLKVDYVYSDYRTIKINPLPDTLVAEPLWGQKFLDNISKAERYVVNSKNLRIFYNSDKNSITFVRE